MTLKTQLKHLNKVFFLLILAIVFIMVIMNINNTCSTPIKEGWFVYKDENFGSYQTGYTDPKGFYIRPEYRKPYRYPVGFKTNNPIEHISSLNPWS